MCAADVKPKSRPMPPETALATVFPQAKQTWRYADKQLRA